MTTLPTDEKQGELLSCPFCGGKASVEQIPVGAVECEEVRFSVGCDAADEIACMGYQNFTTFARRSEAIKAWNTRPLLQEEGREGKPVAWRYGRKSWDGKIWRTVSYLPADLENIDDWIIEPLYALPPSGQVRGQLLVPHEALKNIEYVLRKDSLTDNERVESALIGIRRLLELSLSSPRSGG